MVLHTARAVRGGAKDIAVLQRNRGRNIPHNASWLKVSEINVRHIVLACIVLRQQRKGIGRHIMKPRLKLVDLQTKLVYIEPDLIQVPAGRGALKIPARKKLELLVDLGTEMLAHGFCALLHNITKKQHLWIRFVCKNAQFFPHQIQPVGRIRTLARYLSV